MKILMVSIPNHHFFQWVNQLENSGHEVYWFDISDSGFQSDRIKWVNQIQGWKLKWDFPGRKMLKSKLPKVYQNIRKFNERSEAIFFKKLLDEIKPEVVHSFAMQLSCIPILQIMKEYSSTKWIYSSWGSDIFLYERLGITTAQFQETLQRVNYLITDCKRDYQIALKNNFKNSLLGVYMGNGGLEIDKSFILNLNERNILLIKGYEDGIGKALKIIEAIESLSPLLFENLEIIIYSADIPVKESVENSNYFKRLNVKVIERGQFVSNDLLLKMMGKSVLHVANSISDGLPTSCVEAMGMGAFPLQSNPGNVSEEVVTHGKNGYLIENPLDSNEIAKWIESALKNSELRQSAQQYNTNFVDENYNRKALKKQIIKMYESIP